jgi:hypothetical protein
MQARVARTVSTCFAGPKHLPFCLQANKILLIVSLVLSQFNSAMLIQQHHTQTCAKGLNTKGSIENSK